jgi:hypothetical protein
MTGWSDVNYLICCPISFTCNSQFASYGIHSWTQDSRMQLSQSYCILRFPFIYFKVETLISLSAKIWQFNMKISKINLFRIVSIGRFSFKKKKSLDRFTWFQYLSCQKYRRMIKNLCFICKLWSDLAKRV